MQSSGSRGTGLKTTDLHAYLGGILSWTMNLSFNPWIWRANTCKPKRMSLWINKHFSLSHRRSVGRWTQCLRSCCPVSLLWKPRVRTLPPPLLPHLSLQYPPLLLDPLWRREASACAAEVSSNPKTNKTEGDEGMIDDWIWVWVLWGNNKLITDMNIFFQTYSLRLIN